jgi:Ribbon-helix-helix protein, copG family
MHEVIEGDADRSGGTWQVGRGEASDFRFKFVDEQDRKTRTSWPHKIRAKSMPQSPKAPMYPQLNVRMDEELLRRIDAWRRQQEDIPNRPEAVRRLVEQALGPAPKGRKAQNQ